MGFFNNYYKMDTEIKGNLTIKPKRNWGLVSLYKGDKGRRQNKRTPFINTQADYDGKYSD